MILRIKTLSWKKSNQVKKKTNPWTMDQTNPQTHLVKDATLTDELLSGLGVDSNGKANMWDK